MTTPPAPTGIEPDRTIALGRTILIVLIALALLATLTVIAFTLLVAGPGRLPVQIVRFVLTAALLSCVYAGYPWARWLTVVLFGLAAAASGVSAVALVVLSENANPVAILLLIGLGAIHGLWFGALVVPNPVTIYLKSRRKRA